MTLRPLLLAAAVAAFASLPEEALATDLAIVGARVLPAPDAEPLENATVLVRDGRILAVGPADEVKVPEGADVIDGRGRTLAAGFWNSHTHFMGESLSRAEGAPVEALSAELCGTFNRWGFTTLFEIGGVPGNAATLARRIEAGELPGPRILSVDLPFYPVDGTPIYVREFVASHPGMPSAEVGDAGQAQARARAQLAAGADGVKLFTGAIVGGETGVIPMRPSVARAVVEEAKAAGKPSFAHPTTLQGLMIAFEAGVEVLSHPPFGEPWDADLRKRLAEAGVAMTPTLTLLEHEVRKEGAPEDVIARLSAGATRQVREFVEAGGEVLFGTDVDFISHVDTTREYELLAQAGLDWRAILASLTTAPARRFGDATEEGRIVPGYRADLVLLEGDPREDVTAFARVRLSLRGGETVYSASVGCERGQAGL